MTTDENAGHRTGTPSEQFYLPSTLPMAADTPTVAPQASPDDTRESSPVPPWFRRGIVFVGFVVVAFLVGSWAFTQIGGFWLTLAFAFFIGLAMEPIVNRLERRGLRRGAGTGLVLGGLILGTTLFFIVFGNLLVTQIAALLRNIPTLIDDALEWVNGEFGTDLAQETLLDSLGISTLDLANAAADFGVGLLGIVGQTVGLLFSLLMMLLFSFYFAADGPKLRRTVAAWLPPSRQRQFVTVWDISTAKAGSYVISRGILAIISAIAHGVFFVIIGLPYWLPLSLWVGFVSQFIPTIGTYLAGALPIVIALVIGEPFIALAVLVFIVIYQQVENLILTPRITQQTLEVHAAIAFGSVIVGGSLFGATGALLAIPVVAVVLAVMETYGRRYELVPELKPDAATTRADAATTQG
ncbi:MAG: AI-2E family transporter [Jiangellales bacterium]